MVSPSRTSMVLSSTRKSSSSTEGTHGSSSHRFVSMKRGSQSFEALVRPFGSALASRCWLQNRSLSDLTPVSWSGYAAVLFVDLSGYSKITNALAHKGAFVLSKIVNDYLEELLRVVQLFGGDVVKFAGDAIIVVWEGTAQEDLTINVRCAAQCATQMQELAGDYPVEGTDLKFRIHCGLCCGALDTEVFSAPKSEHMQKNYHIVSGDPLMEIGKLVDLAKAGEICVSNDTAKHLEGIAEFRDSQPQSPFGRILVELNLNANTDKEIDAQIEFLRKEREQLRIPKLEEDFIHPLVLKQLAHGGSQIAQMRNLCVLFIAKTSSGNSANWLMEVHHVLDTHRCPIIQIIDDDKGVHLTAAVNLHESVPEATTLALKACRALIFKQVGCAVGMAMGWTFCGVTGAPTIACRWDITGAPVVRAARLMQYSLSEGIEIAIDHSVYSNASNANFMTPFSCIFLKGSREPVTVYVLSSATSLAASMILETFAFAPIHQEQVEELTAYLNSGYSRGAALVTGPPLTGKKVVCQRAAGLAGLVPILHVGDPTAGNFQLGRTLVEWLLHTKCQTCVHQATIVKDHITHKRWSRAHDECVTLINMVVKKGFHLCVVVDRVQDMDTFSESLVRECLFVKSEEFLKPKYVPRHSSSSSYGAEGVESDSFEDGKFFVLACHTPLYNTLKAEAIASSLVRTQNIRFPIIQVAEATKEDLKTYVQKSIDLRVDDEWLDDLAEACGHRAGYMFQRLRRIRTMSVDNIKAGKKPLSVLSDDLTLHGAPGMAESSRAITVDQVSADTAMRYARVFDALPPSFQTFVELITVATKWCFYKVPLDVVSQSLSDLFAESDEATLDIEVALVELEELFILCCDGSGSHRRVYLTCPALSDMVYAVLTPSQIATISSALVCRLEDCEIANGTLDHLVMASLAGVGSDVACQHEHWKLAHSRFMEESNTLDQRELKKRKELLVHHIGHAIPLGGVAIDTKQIRSLCPIVAQLKYYSGPVTYGPLGHTLSVISRNCFKEIRTSHGASAGLIEKMRGDIKSACQRYKAQIKVVEDYLREHDYGLETSQLEAEVAIVDRLSQPAHTESDSLDKVQLFLNEFLPKCIEPRMARLRAHAQDLRSKHSVPFLFKDSAMAIRVAYLSCIEVGRDRFDAVQDALVDLASMQWAPKSVPEKLPVFFYQTVSTLRNRLMRKLTEAELILFRHQHQLDDLEAFLILNALLPEKDRPSVK